METTEQLAIDACTKNDQTPAPLSGNGFGWNNIAGLFQKSSSDKNMNRNDPKRDNNDNNNNNNQTSNSATNNNNAPHTNRTNSLDAVDRYQYDMEQAKLLRKGMKKHQPPHDRIVKRKEEVTESDVLLALDGLDQADSFQRQGRIREALKVSQLSMELLIHFLQSDPSVVVVAGMSRESVGIRVQHAMTNAEAMKEMIRKRSSMEGGDGLDAIGDPKSSTSLSQSLSTALERFAVIEPKSDGSSPQRTNTGTSTSTSKQQHPRQQPPGQSTSSTVVPKSTFTPSTTRRNVLSSAKTSTNPNTTHHQHPVPTQHRNIASPLANSTDPMVQTIKSELYIDQSQLQSTTWKDIAGLEEAKQSLQEAAILPLMRPDLFSGLRKPRNIILYGPPGTGKTLLVKAVAHESACLLFICTASSLTSKWHGEGEKLLRTLFDVARAAAPSIIFVDEMDALLSSRKSDGEHEASRRFKTEFMTQMDGIVKTGSNNSNNLLLIAATNCPWDIDSAVLRRFPRRIYVPLPDSVTRKALLTNLLSKAGKNTISSADIKAIVKRLSGFSGSDIASIASEASFGPIRSLGGMDAIRDATSNDIRPIERRDFDSAIDQATKSVSKKLLKQYDEWKQEQAATA
jgi:SpoVK/Ycf46/Vps4 family AAA+-type ATPase